MFTDSIGAGMTNRDCVWLLWCFEIIYEIKSPPFTLTVMECSLVSWLLVTRHLYLPLSCGPLFWIRKEALPKGIVALESDILPWSGRALPCLKVWISTFCLNQYTISSPTGSKGHGRTQSSENMQVTWTSRGVVKRKHCWFALKISVFLATRGVTSCHVSTYVKTRSGLDTMCLRDKTYIVLLNQSLSTSKQTIWVIGHKSKTEVLVHLVMITIRQIVRPLKH